MEKMTEKTMGKDRKTLGVLLLSGAAAALLLALLTAGAARKEEPQENRMAQIMADVPDAEDHALPETKTEAYEHAAAGGSRLDSYWESCEEVYEEMEQEKEEEKATPAAPRGSGSGGATAGELFGQAPPPPVGAAPEYRNPYAETPEEREERHRKRREETVRLAREMSGAGEDPPAAPAQDTAVRITAGGPEVKRSSIISSLDDGWDSEGVSTLGAEERIPGGDGLHPIRCMFAKDSRISNGQRVSVILLEDIVVSGTLVPKNTHIMAGCRLSGRLELELMNIEMDGRILPLGYEAYDVDGNRGIYCPDVGSGGRQVRSRGRSLIGSRLSGMMGGLARDVMNTGVSIMQNRDGETTVTVPAGYTFFIVKKKNQQTMP